MNKESTDYDDTEDIDLNADVEQNVGEKRCTCDDKWQTKVCPVCFKDHDENHENVVVVTDDNIVPEKIRQWTGYAYKCPKCGQETILHLMKYCGNCGVGLIIKSAELTSFINKLNESNKGGSHG